MIEQRRLGGRLATVGVTEGAGPPVVLLAGCGVPHPVWEPVLARLVGRRVVWLDRPGMGGTPWPGRVPTLSEEVATLAELAAGESVPVVWVAHSMAGPHAEAVTRQYPSLVAGVVLVDSSVEWWAPGAATHTRSWQRLATASYWAGRAGVGRVGRALAGGPAGTLVAHGAELSPTARAELVRLFAQPDSAAMTVAEFGGYAAQIRELYALRVRHRWPRVPTEVLTAGRGSGPGWSADQARLARLLEADHRTVDSGHAVMLGRPDVVVDSIGRVSSRAG